MLKSNLRLFTERVPHVKGSVAETHVLSVGICVGLQGNTLQTVAGEFSRSAINV